MCNKISQENKAALCLLIHKDLPGVVKWEIIVQNGEQSMLPFVWKSVCVHVGVHAYITMQYQEIFLEYTRETGNCDSLL